MFHPSQNARERKRTFPKIESEEQQRSISEKVVIGVVVFGTFSKFLNSEVAPKNRKEQCKIKRVEESSDLLYL